MELLDFEKYFEKKILKRGKDYFSQGHIEKIEEISLNHFSINVIGTDIYTVYLILDDEDRVIETNCECPYDFSDYCKHQAAALYAIRNERKPKLNVISKKENSITQKKDLKSIISNLKKDELISIILNISNEYKEIEKKLLFKYDTGQDEVKTSKKLIKEYIKRSCKHGFVEWNKVLDALQGAYMILEKARKKIKEDKTEDTILLTIVVLSEVVDLIQYCDDSSGYIGDVIAECFGIMEDSVSKGNSLLNESQKEKLFSNIIKEALNNRYNDWSEWRFSLLKICIYFSDNINLRYKLEQILENLISNLKDSSWSADFEKKNIKLLQLKIIEYNDSEAKVNQFIYDNIQFSNFREIAIIRHLERKEYSKVVSLCEEGENIDKEEYRGLVFKWKKYKLKAYEELGDNSKQAELLIEFIYNNHFEYFLKLKKLYNPDKWPEMLQELLKNFEKQKYLPSVYLEILKEEKLTEKILQYCKLSIGSIEDLYSYLIDEFFEEVNDLFYKHIELEAFRASNRKNYKNVCKIITKYKKVCGEVHANKIINELSLNYHNKPAFIDELGKLY